MTEYMCNKIVEEYLENAYIKSNFNIHNKTNDEIDIWWNYTFLPNVVRNDTQYEYEYNISDFYADLPYLVPVGTANIVDA